MSFVDPASPTSPAPARRDDDGSSPYGELESRTWRAREIARSPSVSLPSRKGRGLQIATDRVRARAAVTPTVSGAIGQTAIGLGVAGMFFPEKVSGALGLQASPMAVRTLFGLREMASGWALVGDPTRTSVLWGRVAGDVFDLAVLRSLDRPDNPQRRNVRAALAFVAVATALDVITATRMSTVQRNCEPQGTKA